MANETETSETKRVEAIAGPWAGRQIDLPSADADQAIADGWARDPFAPPADPNAEPEEFDQEKHDTMTAAAEKAARKIRGEKEPDEAGEKIDKANETRSLEADKPATTAGYQTRSASRTTKTDK
jgi:hypothetical protein